LRFAELCLAAGIPPGVVNVVPGGPLTGAALCGHPGVDKVSFTGGAATAQKVLAAAAVNLTPAVLELGGKSANLIFDDAELAAAVPFAASLSMLRTGQACLVPSRLLVAESIYDQVVERLVAVLSALKVGSPRDMATDIGPVISKDRCAAIETIIDDARTTGAGRLVTGGRRLGGALANGFFIEPTVFADVDTSSGLAQEEIFGPVLCVTPFIDETEAVALANSTRYGLSAYVWTNDLKRTHRLARQLVAGAVCINGFAVPVNAPFGGQRHSGFGREGGRYGLDEFLSPKNVFVGL
jgi:aldehyde dehydrogenase (NAD+)